MSKADPSRWAGLTPRVFCGNLPYNVTEELLAETFRTVGPVVSTRLVSDRETGKMKGFGFVEFPDPETASSAVRNMNGYILEGRDLRVDHAEPEKVSRAQKNNQGRQRMASQQQQQQGGPQGSGPPPMPNQQPQALPQGIQLPPGASATDAITQTLAAMPPDQLLDIMSQMKTLVTSSPEQARNLLNAHPQLAYALFQAMVLMKVVDAGVLQRMLAASLGGQQAQPSMDPTGPAPPPMASAVPPQARNPPMQVPTPPPQAQSAYYSQAPPPPAPSAPAPAAGAPPALDTQTQAALLQQVMAMSQAQIDALPPKDRATVMQLRTQLQSMGR